MALVGAGIARGWVDSGSFGGGIETVNISFFKIEIKIYSSKGEHQRVQEDPPCLGDHHLVLRRSQHGSLLDSQDRFYQLGLLGELAP